MFSTGTWLTICSLLYPPRPILCVVVAAHILPYNNVHQVGQNCIPQLFHSADKHFCLTLPTYSTLLVKVVHTNDRYLHDYYTYLLLFCSVISSSPSRGHSLPRFGGWERWSDEITIWWLRLFSFATVAITSRSLDVIAVIFCLGTRSRVVNNRITTTYEFTQ